MPVVVSFPDEGWLRDVGPVDGVTSVLWDPSSDPPA